MRIYERCVEISFTDIAEAWLSGKFPDRYNDAVLTIPVVVKVSDADGDDDSYVVNVDPDAIIQVTYEENYLNEKIQVNLFCQLAGIFIHALGNHLMTDDLKMDAQHRFIYG